MLSGSQCTLERIDIRFVSLRRIKKTLGVDRLFLRAMCALLSVTFIANPALALSSGANIDQPVEVPQVMEAAALLGIADDLRSVLSLSDQVKHGGGETARRDLMVRKSVILKRILLGDLEVRQACDAIDEELGTTYDQIDKESKKRDRLVTMCNIVNFTQFGVQFALAAAFRLQNMGLESNILVETTAAGTLGFSTLGLLAAKTGRSRDNVTPNALADFFDLAVPAENRLPEMIEKFVDSPPPGASKTRKQLEIEAWQTYYHLDPSSKEKLGHLAAYPQDVRGESLPLLADRLVLLYALNSLVEQFDDDLLALLRCVEEKETMPPSLARDESARYLAKLSPAAADAAKMLNMELPLADLMDLRHKYGTKVSSDQHLGLEVLLVEKALDGSLEVRKAVDRIDWEKHYQYDVVLAQLTGQRARALGRYTTANFLQTGILKAIAGICFFNTQPKAGEDLLMVLTSLNVLLATLALNASKGGKRKIDTDPNVLSQCFSLDPPADFKLSALMNRYLNSVPPNVTETSTRREILIARWKRHHYLRNVSNQEVFNRLADMPSEKNRKVDTIQLASQRLRMLFDVKTVLESFDDELLALLCAPDAVVDDPDRLEAPTLANIRTAIGNWSATKNTQSSTDDLSWQLKVTRKIFAGALEVRDMNDQLDDELAREYTVQDEMIAKANKEIEITNSINFMQSGATGLVGGGLSYSGPAPANAGNDLNIVSGAATIALASLTLLQARGGKRPSKADPNLLGAYLDTEQNGNPQFTPMVWEHLNSVPPGSRDSMTRRQLLIDHWKKAGILTIDLSQQKNLEKVAANGPGHTEKCESIKLIGNRIKMLHDVSTQVETLDRELLASLRAVN